jgi:glycosyltransferase involved in cell wall biosynthesis
MTKPLVCFFLGPTSLSTTEKFGSELAMESLVRELTKHFHVFVSIDPKNEEGTRDGVKYIHHHRLHRWHFDVMVVSRYVSYFVEFDARAIADRTFVWLHDVDFNAYWKDGIWLGGGSSGWPYPIVSNIDPMVTAYVTLSPWHLDRIRSLYSRIDPSKLYMIGHGLYDHPSHLEQKKTPGKFVWISDPVRGLDRLLDFFPRILEKIPHARMEVFRDLPQELKTRCASLRWVTLKGHATTPEITDALRTSEYWFYPTDFPETYCISALEAQAAGCVCIATDLAALTTTVSDERGFLLKTKPIYSREYWDEAMSIIEDLEANPEKKRVVREKAMEWARTQTWESKATYWNNLFSGRDAAGVPPSKKLNQNILIPVKLLTCL